MKIGIEMVTTSFELPGYTIVRSLSVVRGVSVRSLNALKSLQAGLQTIFGGKNINYTALCEKTRQDAFEILIEHAQEIGANAIIGMRYDANEIAPGITEVIAYGTAVIAERKKD